MSEENKVNAINDDTLEGVSGGLIFDASNISGAKPETPFEVLDDNNGQVLARAKSAEYTEDWDKVQKLRGGK